MHSQHMDFIKNEGIKHEISLIKFFELMIQRLKLLELLLNVQNVYIECFKLIINDKERQLFKFLFDNY